MYYYLFDQKSNNSLHFVGHKLCTIIIIENSTTKAVNWIWAPDGIFKSYVYVM